MALFEKHPTLGSLSLEYEFEYNDEGGYYRTLNVGAMLDRDDEGLEEAIEDEVQDDFDRDALAGLINVEEGEIGDGVLRRPEILAKWRDAA